MYSIARSLPTLTIAALLAADLIATVISTAQSIRAVRQHQAVAAGAERHVVASNRDLADTVTAAATAAVVAAYDRADQAPPRHLAIVPPSTA